MRYYRCKCGALEAWGSMSPTPCRGCKKCGTTLDGSPEQHRTPEPHKFIVTKIEADDGQHDLSVCQWCGKTKRELDAAGVTQ